MHDLCHNFGLLLRLTEEIFYLLGGLDELDLVLLTNNLAWELRFVVLLAYVPALVVEQSVRVPHPRD